MVGSVHSIRLFQSGKRKRTLYFLVLSFFPFKFRKLTCQPCELDVSLLKSLIANLCYIRDGDTSMPSACCEVKLKGDKIILTSKILLCSFLNSFSFVRSIPWLLIIIIRTKWNLDGSYNYMWTISMAIFKYQELSFLPEVIINFLFKFEWR